MNKNYLLMLLLALISNVFAFGKTAIGDPVKTNPVNCFDMPELTVLHPRCESPETGTITVTYPQSENYWYSIDGINYQTSPFFDLVLPGIYDVTYKDISGCVSEVNTVMVDPAMPYAIINIDPLSNLMQSICKNTAIATITYTLGGTATEATVTGLPAGVSGSFSNGVFTISGTATALGVYNFSIVTNGGCPATLTGTIVVKPNAALAWINSSGSRNQTLCQHAAIAPIRHIVANGATGAETIGLPSGLDGTFEAGIFTISGMPTVSGTYNYTISTIGGCSVATVSGVITVNASQALGLQCNDAVSNAVAFQWQAISGVSSYNYSYSIDDGASVSGAHALTSFTVPGVLPGQSVAFSISGVNGSSVCVTPQSATCTLTALGTESFDRAAVSYYPNPVIDVLHLECGQPFSNIAIYNTMGQEVLFKRIDSNKAAIDISSLQSGIYFAKVSTAAASKTIRLVKD